VYSGVYFQPSALTGDALGDITALSFNYTGSPTEGNGPRFSLPVDADTDGTMDGATDFYLFIDARDCNNGAGLVDVIKDATCTIFWTSGPVSGVTNWATLAGDHPTWTLATVASENGGTTPFIIADGPGAWAITNVHMGN